MTGRITAPKLDLFGIGRQRDENGKSIVPISVDDREVREMAFLFVDMESIAELGDPGLFVREGVRFPFSEFECGVLNQLKCAPTQIHPNAWAFTRGFEILMEYLGTKPLLEVFFSFFQAKGVQKGGTVTLNSVQGKALFGLYRQSYKDFKEMYVKVTCETTTGGLKNFFKSRAERGHSASNVIKAEEGAVVNQPPEKRRVPSMKRRRTKEGGSSKKVIYLTSIPNAVVWSEHFPIFVVAEEHFQSKTDLDLISSVDDLTRAQFMQVCAARLLCLGRYEELKAREEASQKKE
ncbi:hypothetical protein PIB30_061998 [Stylosanthes scabra]|uniref:Transposase (putative) gypsy type domain-containing protein n=1 Tax=Stylosanthes scabra TaxID=79078 RepID=A0ABU6XIV3_9FABA|nr:hypothetical protein [Stylosanthes scabra]